MVYVPFRRQVVAKARIALTLDEAVLERLDRLLREEGIPDRSRAIQEAVEEKLEWIEWSRLVREYALLDPRLAEELAEGGVFLPDGDRALLN